MKKLSLVLILGMLLGLTACGSETTQDEAKGATDTQAESNVDNVKDAQTDADEEDKDAVTSVAENFTYTEENGEITITGYEGEATVLEIPDSINGMPVVAIGENAFAGNEVITEVIFPDSVVLIDNSAFERCYSLTKATFGANLEIINYAAFWMAPLESVEFPDTVYTIGDYAFCYTNIKEIVIPPLVTEIPDAAFGGTKIESLTIPGTVREIGYQAFRTCNELKVVVVEDGVEIIGEYAFGECDLLESVTFPTSITTLDDSVVSGSGQGESIVYLYVPAGGVAESVLGEKYSGSQYFSVVTQ